MKSIFVKICSILISILVVVSLVSGYVDIGIPPFDGLGVALVYVNIVLLILLSIFLLLALAEGGKSILKQEKLLGQKTSYMWRNTESTIIFVVVALTGHIITAVLYAIAILIYRAFEYTARLEYKKLTTVSGNDK
ncbi:hypothetical protein P748_gp026 [Klebsiella phage 0507-KN2-1]|uniref:Uncharacterized protein n=1 Tax=Klebsiella phage 0507-KN2-1 TaxID=2991282 RepID=S6C8M9_BPK05|nr:hypothetical protein P748_gp026 [Klebsiella phage 0507-KN2-1]BAN78376.1 hypothetical protein [Klebsiella phage 0507-KN2-1]